MSDLEIQYLELLSWVLNGQFLFPSKTSNLDCVCAYQFLIVYIVIISQKTRFDPLWVDLIIMNLLYCKINITKSAFYEDVAQTWALSDAEQEPLVIAGGMEDNPWVLHLHVGYFACWPKQQISQTAGGPVQRWEKYWIKGRRQLAAKTN